MEAAEQPDLRQAVKNRADMARVKHLYDTQVITRDEAKMLAQPIIDRVNAATIIKTEELNRKYGLKRKPVTLDFVNCMRNTY